MTTDIISPDLKTILRRLRLSRILDTLPERLVLARQQKLPHQDWLLLILSDEATRRDSLAVTLRVQKAHLDPSMHLEAWDPTARSSMSSRRCAFSTATRTSRSSGRAAWAKPFSPTPLGTSLAAAGPRC